MPKLTGFPSVAIPGPAPIPLIGPIPRMMRFFDDPIGESVKLRSYGDVVSVSRGSPAMVCVFGAERNREVLGNPTGFEHDENFVTGPEDTALARMSKVLVNINGELHKRHRKLMMPAFAKSSLDGYAEQIVRVTEGMIERWPFGEVVDLDVLLRDVALAMAVRTLFGLDVLSGATKLGELAAELINAMTSPGTILFPHDLPGTPYRRAMRCAERVLSEMDQLIERKRRGGEVSNDALGLMLQAVDDEGAKFTDAELIAETVTLFIAGHETTAKTLTWTMFLLERHPDVLADVLDEIDGVLGGRSMTAADIPDLPLLDRVIKESMRVLAPVPILFLRVPTTDAPLGRFTLPKGSNVIVSPYMTHHDPELYPRPERFEPQRWEQLKPTPFEYLPFGAGPRICIGAAFAQQALRLMMPTLLQRMRIAVVRGHDVSRLTRANILLPRHGLRVYLQQPHRRRLTVEPICGDVREMVELPS
jgi:cytochrome P450